ncbi:hypothetical protein SASPL_112298 [Salvia splendens]|uniref:Reverse transcriptase Ty1/copia-type domain-containing protein n=1 Tax=Salvia splendens TaxID=180675 RepID=A0A8X8Y9S0_SALSN|nr:hypothetical protein SASPL_112298 [Salvia splendens]
MRQEPTFYIRDSSSARHEQPHLMLMHSGNQFSQQQKSINFVEDTASLPSIDQYQRLISLLQSQQLHNLPNPANTSANDLSAQSTSQPSSSSNFSGSGQLVCRLTKSLYGLKQASRQWYLKFSQVLSGFGLTQSASDHSLFYKYSASGSYFGIVIYVDDILVASSEASLISDFKTFLAEHFKFKDLGYPKYFLGIEIARNKSGIFVSQHKYALDLVSDAGLLGCKPASTPMDSIKQLQADAGPQLEDPTVYRRLIGRLVYLCITRPDITFAVNKLSQFLSKPCSDHLIAAERVLKYLKGTIGHGLFYSSQADLSLSIFSDADWADVSDEIEQSEGSQDEACEMPLAESRPWPLNPALLTAPPFLNQQPVATSDGHPPSLYSAPSNPKFSYDSLELIADVTDASKKPCPIIAIDQLLDRDHVGAEGVFLDDEEKVGILTVALECMPTGLDYWATTYISDINALMIYYNDNSKYSNDNINNSK